MKIQAIALLCRGLRQTRSDWGTTQRQLLANAVYHSPIHSIATRTKTSTSTTAVLTLKKKICVVGAGPAGFYAAQYLVKHLADAEVDIVEKLPVPFGLVR